MSRHVSYRIPSELVPFVEKLARKLDTDEYSKTLTFCLSFTRCILDSERLGMLIGPAVAEAYNRVRIDEKPKMIRCA